jgi:4-diphosphocytidyl-2-C-methyl-D-erythritol kinase
MPAQPETSGSTREAMSVRELARAKINLTLTVHGRRADGYHELESLVTFAGIHDVVTLAPGDAGGVAVAGPFARYISGENLLIRALGLLRQVDRGLRLEPVRLEKNLPVAAGLGGGSADAAALLRAVRRANPHSAPDFPWEEIAARLGADVPVCFGDRPALVCGVGHDVVPVRSLPPMQVVLVNPGVPLPTARVFAALEADPAPSSGTRPAPPELPRLEDLLGYMRARGNGLERAATGLLPVIGEVKAALEALLDCRLAAMSGSGPSCFGIYGDRESARRAGDSIAAAHPGWWVKSTALAGAA